MSYKIAPLSPLENLVNIYGSTFELICDRHKMFVVAALIDSMLYECSLWDSWDEIDPQAFLPEDLTASFSACDRLSRAEKINLIKAISEQLAAAANRPTK